MKSSLPNKPVLTAVRFTLPEASVIFLIDNIQRGAPLGPQVIYTVLEEKLNVVGSPVLSRPGSFPDGDSAKLNDLKRIKQRIGDMEAMT